MSALKFAAAVLISATYLVPAVGQIAPRPVPPSDTTVPVGARLLAQVIGDGVQIYKCVERNGALIWDFQAPEAKLLDPATRQVLGAHGAGPMWRWNDNSAVSGKVLRTQASLEADSVPWLLLAASPLGDQKGLLSPVIYVRRSETHGGKAPAGNCVESQVGTMARVPYNALYGFYTADTPVSQQH